MTLTPKESNQLARDIEEFIEETGEKLIGIKRVLQRADAVGARAIPYWVNNILGLLDPKEYGIMVGPGVSARKTQFELEFDEDDLETEETIMETTNMKSCQGCGQNISKQARECPHCGYFYGVRIATEKDLYILLWIFIIFIIIVFITVVS